MLTSADETHAAEPRDPRAKLGCLLDPGNRLYAYCTDATRMGGAIGADVVDEIVDPAKSRRRIAEALAEARPGRGNHGNIPL
jgi:hypothetical protein